MNLDSNVARWSTNVECFFLFHIEQRMVFQIMAS